LSKPTALQKYLQYSKRIAIFGICQWAVIALAALGIVLLSDVYSIMIDEYASRVINNVITCSSALAVAICSGYYAHSAYDNNLKQRIASALNVSEETTEDDEPTGNG